MWNILAAIVRKFGTPVKAVLDDYDPAEWSSWFIIPHSGYGETENYGPFKLERLRVMRIQPIVLKHIGNRIPPKKLDYTEEISAALAANHITFEIKDGIILVSQSGTL